MKRTGPVRRPPLVAIGMLALAPLLVSAAGSPPAPTVDRPLIERALADPAPTVGSFVQRLAREHGLPAATPGEAVAALETAGADLPATLDLDTLLTERDVVAIARALGVRVTTSRPDAPFDRGQVQRFVDAVVAADPSAASAGTNGDRPPPPWCVPPPGEGPGFSPFVKGAGLQKGKGKRKGGGLSKGCRTAVDPD